MAALLIEISAGDAVARRRLRLAIVEVQGGGKVTAALAKRLSALGEAAA